MSKAYPSNLTQAQFEYLNDLLPAAKPGGRPRAVDLWEVLNAIFYVLVEGVRWRAYPVTFQLGKPDTPIFGTGIEMELG